jgi:hypothetical protein
MPEPLIQMDTPAAPIAASPVTSAPAAPVAASSAPASPPASPPVRPENVPEAFWDAEKGAIKTDDLVKSYSDIAKFKSEHDAKLAAVPEKADGYVVPETLIDDEVAKIIPKDREITIDEKSPMLAFAREFAHSHKLPQEVFEGMVKGYIKQQVLEEKAFAEASEAENKKLGANAPQRHQALKDFLVSNVGEADTKEILSSVFTAKQVEAFERLIARYSNQGNVIPLHQKRDDGSDASPTSQLPMAKRMFPNMAG